VGAGAGQVPWVPSYAGKAEAWVAAPPERCFEAMTDYERLPEWQHAVSRCEVLTRDDRGRGETVRYEVDARVRSVRYTLLQRYDEPHRIDSSYEEGDFRDFTGGWRFEPDGDGTQVTVEASIDPGVRLPRPVVRKVNDWVLSRSVQDLKRYVER
jgi:ribosome-associated toxin RatA of RatAB toxin-antitoxin module